jgi:AraC-like DNA-binding protein
MTIALSHENFAELYDAANPEESQTQPSEPYEFIDVLPPELCREGQWKTFDLCDDLWLSIWGGTFHDDIAIPMSVRDHEVELMIQVSGHFGTEYGDAIGPGEGHFLGSGIAAAGTTYWRGGEPFLLINLGLEPTLLETFFAGVADYYPPQLRSLTQVEDWQTRVPPRPLTPTMQVAVRQILHCPYHGIIKQMYLQAKAFELLALQLEPILADRGEPYQDGLKPKTIEQIYRARDILVANLEHPPLVLALAQQVGLSDRTLQRGFQKLFGTTVFGYLSDRRMVKAEQVLRQGQQTVAAVAAMMGYANPGHFAAAFKRKFGITPSDCLRGKKSVLR